MSSEHERLKLDAEHLLPGFQDVASEENKGLEIVFSENESDDDLMAEVLEKVTAISDHSEMHLNLVCTTDTTSNQVELFARGCSSPMYVQDNIQGQVDFDIEPNVTFGSDDSGVAIEESLSVINSDEDVSIDPEAVETVKTKIKKPPRPCLFCSKLQTRLKRHILTKHKNLAEVVPLLTVNAKEQDRIIEGFRKQAIRNLNLQRLKAGEKNFMRERKTHLDELPVMCAGCKGFFAKSYKARHRLICPAVGTNFMVPAVSIASSGIAEHYSDDFKCVLSTLHLDEIGSYVKTDEIILMIGSRSFASVNRKKDKKTEAKKSVRARMRLTAKVYLAFRKEYNQQSEVFLKDMLGNAADMYRREAITILGSTILSICEKHEKEATEESNHSLDGSVTGLKSGLMISILNLLKLTAKFLIGHFLVKNQDDCSKRVVDFLQVLKLYEQDFFGSAYYEINHRRNALLRKPVSLPKDEDVQQLIEQCNKIMNSIDVFDFEAKSFIPVRSATATCLIIFNARRGGEPVRLRLGQWIEALKGEWVDKARDCEDLGNDMLVTYQTGKGANHLVPVMFPPETHLALNYLSDPDVRKKAGVVSGNDYIFASTQRSSSHASGWHCINEILEKLSLKGAVNATKNRHRIASLLAKLELSGKEKELVYKHFGHSGSINENVYQAAAGSLQLKTTGKRLLEIQSGKSQTDNVNETASVVDDAALLKGSTKKEKSRLRDMHNDNECQKKQSIGSQKKRSISAGQDDVKEKSVENKQRKKQERGMSNSKDQDENFSKGQDNVKEKSVENKQCKKQERDMSNSKDQDENFSKGQDDVKEKSVEIKQLKKRKRGMSSSTDQDKNLSKGPIRRKSYPKRLRKARIMFTNEDKNNEDKNNEDKNNEDKNNEGENDEDDNDETYCQESESRPCSESESCSESDRDVPTKEFNKKKCWSEGARKAFEEMFEDYLKQDRGYPKRIVMERFGISYGLTYMQVRTRIVNDRRIRKEKARAASQEMGINQ